MQLVVPVQGRRFSARADGLDVVPADRVTFSVIAWSRVAGAAPVAGAGAATFLPDVIVPLDGSVAGLRTFDIPLKVAGLPEVGNRQGLLLMEVWIPKTAAAGVHRGTVSVLEEGKERARLGIDLTVFPLRLPDRPTFRMDYLSYGSPLESLEPGRRRGRRWVHGLDDHARSDRAPNSKRSAWLSTTVAT